MASRTRRPSCGTCEDNYFKNSVVMASSCLLSSTDRRQESETEPSNIPTSRQTPSVDDSHLTDSYQFPHVLPSYLPAKAEKRPMSCAWALVQNETLDQLLVGSSGVPKNIPSASWGGAIGTGKNLHEKHPEPTIQRRREKSSSNANGSSRTDQKGMNSEYYLQTQREFSLCTAQTFKTREVNGGCESSVDMTYFGACGNNRRSSKQASDSSSSGTINRSNCHVTASYGISERTNNREDRKDHEAYFNYSDDDDVRCNSPGRPLPSSSSPQRYSPACPTTPSSRYGGSSAISPPVALRVNCEANRSSEKLRRSRTTRREMSQPGSSLGDEFNGKPPRLPNISKGFRQDPTVDVREAVTVRRRAVSMLPSAQRTSGTTVPTTALFFGRQPVGEETLQNVLDLNTILEYRTASNGDRVLKKNHGECGRELPSLMASKNGSPRLQLPPPGSGDASNGDDGVYQYAGAVCGARDVNDHAGAAASPHHHVYERVDADYSSDAADYAVGYCQNNQQSNKTKNNQTSQNNFGSAQRNMSDLYMVGPSYESIGKHNKRENHYLNEQRWVCREKIVDTRNPHDYRLNVSAIIDNPSCESFNVSHDYRLNVSAIIDNPSCESFNVSHIPSHRSRPQTVQDDNRGSNLYVSGPRTDTDSQRQHDRCCQHPDYSEQNSDRPLQPRSRWSSKTGVHHAGRNFASDVGSGVGPGVGSDVASCAYTGDSRDNLAHRSLVQLSRSPPTGPAGSPPTYDRKRDPCIPRSSQDTQVYEELGGGLSDCSSDTHVYAEIEESPSEGSDSSTLPRMKCLSVSTRKFFKKYSCVSNS